MPDFEITGEVEVRVSKALRSLSRFQNRLRELKNDVDELDRKIDSLSGKSINVDVTGATSSIAQLEAVRNEVEEIPNHVNVNVDVDKSGISQAVQSANNLTDALGAVSRTAANTSKIAKKAGNKFRWMASGIALLGTVAAPAIVSAAGALGGFTSFVIGAGTAVGAFAAVAGPTFAALGKQSKTVLGAAAAMATAEKGTQRYKNAVKALNQVRKNSGVLTKDMIDSLKELGQNYGELQEAIKPDVIKAWNDGISIANTLLSELSPVVKDMGKALAEMSEKAKDALKTDEWQDFFNFVNKNGAKWFKQFTTGIGNIISGLKELAMAFEPLADKMGKGWVQMTKDFEKWTKSLKNSEEFEKFLKMVSKYGPKVLDFFQELAEFLWNVTKALAPVGMAIMDVFKWLLKLANAWQNASPKTFNIAVWATVAALGALGAALIGKGLVKGFKKLSDAIFGTKFALRDEMKKDRAKRGELDKLKKKTRKTGDAFDDLGEDIDRTSRKSKRATKRFGRLRGAMRKLGRGARSAGGKLRGLGSVLRKFPGLLVAAGGMVAGFGKKIWGLGKKYIPKAWNSMKNLGSTVGRFAKTKVPGALNAVKRWGGKLLKFGGKGGPLALLIGGLGVASAKIEDVDKNTGFVMGAMQGLGNLLMGKMDKAWHAFSTGVSNAGKDLKNSITKPFTTKIPHAFNWVKQRAIDVGHWFAGPFVGFFKNMGGTISGVWNTAKRKASGAWKFISGHVSRRAHDIWTSVKGMAGHVGDWMETGWNWAKDAVGSAWDWITGQTSRSGTDMANTAGRKARDAADRIDSGLRSGDPYGVGAGLVSGLAQGIWSGMSSAINAAVSVAQSAWEAAKGFLGIGSPSKLFIDIGSDTIAGFVKGLMDRKRNIVQTIQSLAHDATRWFNNTLGMLMNGGRLRISVDLRRANRGMVSAMMELIRALVHGKTVFEDMSYRGMSANLGQYNDKIADLYYGRATPSDNSTTITVNIDNPRAERGSDSVQRSLSRMSALGLFA